MKDDVISRQAAIDALEKIPVREFKKTDGLLDALVSIGEVYMALKQLPSAQPELIEKAAYIRGFEQGRTQGMIDAQGEQMSRLIDNTIKAEWTNTDALDLQPTCNQLATDTISRQATIDDLNVLCQEHRYKIPGKRETYSQYNEAWQDALDRAEGAILNLPSAQPEIIRCKDCKNYSFCKNYGCKDDDFCSLAERRTDEPDNQTD